MKRRLCIVFLSALCALLGVACKPTAEKIELWKGTTNGPQKLSKALLDPEVPLELRGRAMVALVEIANWELVRDALTKLEKTDKTRVLAAAVPQLAVTVESANQGAGPGKAPQVTPAQLHAKDALFLFLDHVTPAERPTIEKALIAWSSVDFNHRAMAGDFNVTTIVKKVGPPAARALVKLLTFEEPAIKFVAELIRDVNDPDAFAAASRQLAGELKKDPGKIRESHLLAAATIGGAEVVGVLLDISVDKQAGDRLQRLALRALSQAIDLKRVVLDQAQMERIFAMAENTEYDQFQREESYYLVAQGGRVEDVPRLRKVLGDKDPFFRAVAVRCLLRLDGPGQLGPTLDEVGRIGLTTDPDDLNEIVVLIASFPKLMPQVRELLTKNSTFAKAIALLLLRDLGRKDDLALLEPFAKLTTALPKGFEYKTLAAAAEAARAAIEKRG